MVHKPFTIIISLIVIVSSIPFFFVSIDDVSGSDRSLNSIYRLDAEFQSYDGNSRGQEDRYGCYVPIVDAFYTFGGDGASGMVNDILRWNTSEDSNVDPYKVADLPINCCKAGAVWYESLNMVFVYGPRTSPTTYTDNIYRFTIPGHVVTLMESIYEDEKLPSYIVGDLAKSATYSTTMDMTYILSRNSTGDDRVWMAWHNASNHSTGWVDTGGISYDCRTLSHAVYIESTDTIWYVGYMEEELGERSDLIYIYTFTPSGDGTSGTFTNISYTQGITCPYGAEGAFTFYNSDDNWIYVMGGCRDASPSLYSDFVWKLSPSNFSIVNLTLTQDITLLSRQDDGQGFFHSSSCLGFLVGCSSGDDNDVAHQYYIDQVNFTAATPGSIYNAPVINHMGYGDSGPLGDKNVTVGTFWVNWTWDTNDTPSSHLIQIASDTLFSNILIYYNCSHNPSGGYMNTTFNNITASSNKRYIRIRSFYG